MPDPFLEAHALGHLHYGIGGKLSPVSIRDQMFRGRVIIDRAIDAKLIGPDRELLVVGAGAAGATAAMYAANQSIPTTLIDKNKGPFSRQRRCRSRWISPTQYDWPADHWDLDYYPWAGPDMPLPWDAEYSNLLASVWLFEFKLTRRFNPHFRFLRSTKINWRAFKREVAREPTRLEVDFKPHGRGRFGMVIFSGGPGTEVCRVGDYKGFRFWDTDNFEKPHLGLVTPPRILISGGGDGALQDFLRIITKMSTAKDIYNSLPPAAQRAIDKSIASIEDQAQRAYLWTGKWEHDHEAYELLHRLHQRAIGNIINTPSIWGSVHAGLDPIIDASPDAVNVELIHPCNHFSKCYGLNHFLVLLIAAYLLEKSGNYPLRPDTMIHAVQGNGHTCRNNARRCFGKQHDVLFKYADCGTLYGVGASDIEPATIRYQAVIVRHGLEGSNPRGQLVNSQTRQVLPYYVPWSS